MTNKQMQLIENYIRLKVKKVLAEKKSLNESSITSISAKIYQEINGMDTKSKNKFVDELINFLESFKQ